jgi:CxxC-x17-CxxC domain-containing protein
VQRVYKPLLFLVYRKKSIIRGLKKIKMENKRGYGSRQRSFGPRRDFGARREFKREMHKATCAECGEECEVPFKPDGTRPVYCRECYRKKKGY